MSDNGGTYRDTVREMMRDLKSTKKPDDKPTEPAATTPTPASIEDVPNEEDLLDDILDLEEGGPTIVDDEEADKLLKDPDDDEAEAAKDANDYVKSKNGTSDDKKDDDDVDGDDDASKDAPNAEPKKKDTDIVKEDDSDSEKEDEAAASPKSPKEPQDEASVDKKEESDGSSIEMLDDSSKKSSNDEQDNDQDNDEASNSSETNSTKISAPSTSSSGKIGEKASKQEPEVVELSSNEDSESDQQQEEEEKEEPEKDDEVGDPDKQPGEGASRRIHPDHLQPFHYGWRREVVYRARTKHESASECDIYYLPPQEGRYRTREAKRKRRSKTDQERYFEDFPDEILSLKHFNYFRRPLGVENAAYEIIRKSKVNSGGNSSFDIGGRKAKGISGAAEARRSTMKEVEESAGLLEDSDDEELVLIMGFDPELPVCLQALHHTMGMQTEYKKRRKTRDPETCCTPPMAEDSLWTNLDDDPFGVFTDLGGRSSPTTPPPLRALKLTPSDTAEKIIKAIEEVKAAAFKVEATKEIDLHEDMASHDFAIRKFKNFKAPTIDPNWYPTKRPHPQYRNMQQMRGIPGSNSLIMRPAMNRSRLGPCTPKCQGSYGILPNLQCAICKAMFHARCQGLISPNLRVFRCRRCLSRSSMHGTQPQPMQSFQGQQGSSVQLKLPMVPKNGKRPVVELVLRTPEGRYQPIKFRNNSQITETIPRSLFHKANTARKTLYVKSNQLPRLNNRPVFLAINPQITAPGLQPRPFIPQQRTQQRPSPQQQPQQSDQVSILVRPQKSAANSKPVLLNVPRRVALKVKVGTTLSFSASNDQKYIVMDSRIHPPVGKILTAPPIRRPPPPAASPALKRLPLPASLSVIPRSGGGNVNRTLATLMTNKRPGLTVTRGPTRPAKVPRPSPSRPSPSRPSRPSIPGGANVLASGEVVSNSQMAAMTPCTPYCPGVQGFPDLECTQCQSLFHSKCVGISESVVDRLRSTFRCRICTPQQRTSGAKAGPRSGNNVTVIDLD